MVGGEKRGENRDMSREKRGEHGWVQKVATPNLLGRERVTAFSVVFTVRSLYRGGVEGS